MLCIIYPNDKTTEFLKQIVSELTSFIDSGPLKLIEVGASSKSYRDAKQEISSIPKGTFVLFMGHGTKATLYGGTDENFSKESLFKIKEMGIFNDMKLMLLSCNSSELLMSARPYMDKAKLLGFGPLPTSMDEVESTNKIKELGLEQEDVDFFCKFLVEGVIDAIKCSHECGLSLDKVYQTLKLSFNRKMNEMVLDVKNRKQADLLFLVKNQMTYL